MLYAVGDIHGEREMLAELLARLPLRPDDRLLFIGDYIDRGSDSFGVVDLLVKLARLYHITVSAISAGRKRTPRLSSGLALSGDAPAAAVLRLIEASDQAAVRLSLHVNAVVPYRERQ